MLTKTDLSEIDKRIKKTIEKIVRDNNKKLFEVLATKQDFDDNFVTKKEFQKSTNKIMDALDKIYGVVKRNDEEQLVIGHTVKNHEARITKIERIAVSN